MGDTKIVYGEFGIGTFKREICSELGEDFWNELIKDITVPDMESECGCHCRNMYFFMKRFEEMASAETVKTILYRVRHGLHPSQSEWARDEFLEIGDLDNFLQKHFEDELNYFIRLNAEKKDFYGQAITDEVLEFIKRNPSMLAPSRKGNKLFCMAFPYDMEKYLKTTDDKMKRYHACHCPFAKESILSDHVVSPALCNCSLGHVMNFVEGFLGRALEGEVVHSVLNGDLTCEYEITIPDDIMETYVATKGAEIVISNYYRYYSSFALSGVVEHRKGKVNWIMPKEGENGPQLGFGVHLDEETAEKEVQDMIVSIRAKHMPRQWIITPDATPSNIISIMEENGFQNLSADLSEPEPAMLLHRQDFRPYMPADASVTCRKVTSKEDFRVWIEIVNTALHGWNMIDAENYYTWVKNGEYTIYLGEINGVPVASAATIQTGNTGSLEFVSTLSDYRRRKAAITVCSIAVDELLKNGADTVTLGACGESALLYRQLGFRRCFDNIIMRYDGL